MGQRIFYTLSFMPLRATCKMVGSLCVLLFVFATGNLHAQTLPNGEVTASGSYIVPAGVTTIMVEAWGGGGGGVVSGSNGQTTGGGGGGAYAKVYFLHVTPGETLTISIGAGGLGTSTNVGQGGDTYLRRGGTDLIKAVGGGVGPQNGSDGGPGGLATNCVGDIRYSGGAGGSGGGSGSTSGGGGGGAGAGRSNNGAAGGQGANNAGGTGGAGANGGGSGGDGMITKGVAYSGQQYGGGGGGAKQQSNAGNGGTGGMIISYCPQLSINVGISAISPVCESLAAVNVTITGNNTGLDTGTYSVTYTVNGGADQIANVKFNASGTVRTGTISNVSIPTGLSPVTITVTAMSAGVNCNSNPITANNSVTITKTADPPKPTISPASGIICGTPATLTANGTYTNPTYRWYLNGQVISQTTRAVSISQSGNYYVTVTDNGCPATSDTYSYTLKSIATADMITANSINICSGSTATLNAAVTTGFTVANPTFTWYSSQSATVPLFTGPAYTTGVLTNTTVNVQPVTYYVSIMNDNYCENDTGARRPVTVNVYKEYTVTITATQDTVCYNQTVGLTANIDGAYDWIGWYDNGYGQPITGAFLPASTNTPVVTYNPDISAQETTVTVTVRVHNPGCGYMADATVDLRILPENTTATLEIVGQPTTIQDVCADTAYVVKVTAAGAGQLNNVQLILHDINSTALTINKTVSVTTSGNTTYSITGAATTASGDVPGVVWELGSLAPNDFLTITVPVRAGCDFLGNNSLNFYLDYGTACDPFKERITKQTAPFNIIDVENASNINTYIITSQFRDSKGNPVTTWTNNLSDTITWHLEASFDQYRMPTDSSKERINVLLPYEFTLVDGSYDPIQNAPLREKLIVVPQANGLNLVLPLLEDLTINDGDIIAEFKFTTTGAPCATYEVYAEIDYEYTAVCDGDSCAFYVTQGAPTIKPALTIERYAFHIENIQSEVTESGNGYLWNGILSVIALNEFFASDTFYIDLYIDEDNQSRYNPLIDTYITTHTYITTALPAGSTFTDTYTNIPVEPGKQLLGIVRGDIICESDMFHVAILTGTEMDADRVCQYDTIVYQTSPGMTEYAWNVDVITGATPRRIPAPGETIAGQNHPEQAHVIWPREGSFKIWTQYASVGKTYFPVTVDEKPTISFPDGKIRSVCAHLPTDITIVTNSATSSVAWSNYESTGTATGETTNTLHYLPHHRTTDTTIYLIVTAYCLEGSSCDPVVDSVQITIYGSPEFEFADDTTVCGSANLTTLPVISGSTEAILNFQYWNEDYTEEITNRADNITISGIYHIIGLSVYCQDTSTIEVTVNPIPKYIDGSDETGSVCSGDIVPAPTELSSDVAGTTYIIVSTATTGITGNTNSGTTLSSFPPDRLVTTQTVPGTVTYTITPVATNCEGTPKTYTVTVNPLPVLTLTKATEIICSGTPVPDPGLIPDIPTESGTTYIITSVGTGVAGNTLSSSNRTTFVYDELECTGTSPGTVVYTITPVFRGCPGTSQTYTVTVNPKPEFSFSDPAPICSLSTVDLTNLALTSGDTIGLTFTYWNFDYSVQLSIAQASAISVPGSYNIVGINTTNCSDTSTVTLIMKPLPIVSITGSSSICIGTQTQLSPSEGGSWVSNNPSVASVTNNGFVTGITTGSATFTFTSATTDCSNTTDTISVGTFPAINAITGGQSVCINATVQLSCTPAGGVWTFSNANAQIVGGSDDNPVDIKGVTTGQTYVSYTLGTSICRSTSTFLLKIVPASPPEVIIGFGE